MDLSLEEIQEIMIYITKHPQKDRIKHQETVHFWNTQFKMLLHEKPTQKLVQQVSNDDGSSTENTSTSPTDDTARSISIRNILKQQISGRRK